MSCETTGFIFPILPDSLLAYKVKGRGGLISASRKGGMPLHRNPKQKEGKFPMKAISHQNNDDKSLSVLSGRSFSHLYDEISQPREQYR